MDLAKKLNLGGLAPANYSENQRATGSWNYFMHEYMCSRPVRSDIGALNPFEWCLWLNKEQKKNIPEQISNAHSFLHLTVIELSFFQMLFSNAATKVFLWEPYFPFFAPLPPSRKNQQVHCIPVQKIVKCRGSEISIHTRSLYCFWFSIQTKWSSTLPLPCNFMTYLIICWIQLAWNE